MAANPVRVALADRLAAHAPLTALVGTRIHFQEAPQGTAYPLVVFHPQAPSRPHRFMGTNTVEDELWTVKGIATGSSSATTSESIAEAIDDALDNAALVVAGRDTLSLLREGDVIYPEVKGADLYRHCGAMYRLRTE